MGFILSNFINLTSLSNFASIFYFYLYIFVSLNFFMILMLFIKYRSLNFLDNLKHLSLISKSFRFLGYGISILLFSFIGIPPLTGFFTKLVVFQNLSNSSEYALLFIMIFFTVLSSFYYLRLIRKIFFVKKINGVLLIKLSKLSILMFLILVSFNLFFIFLLPIFTFFLDFILQFI